MPGLYPLKSSPDDQFLELEPASPGPTSPLPMQPLIDKVFSKNNLFPLMGSVVTAMITTAAMTAPPMDAMPFPMVTEIVMPIIVGTVVRISPVIGVA